MVKYDFTTEVEKSISFTFCSKWVSVKLVTPDVVC